MRIITDGKGSNPRVLDKNGDSLDGIALATISVGPDGVTTELTLCSPILVDIEATTTRFDMMDPITGSFKKVKSIQYEDGTEWKASDHANA